MWPRTELLVALAVLTLALCAKSASAVNLMEGLYCHKENCYDVLGVTREATKADIAKSYRQLARKYHPDLHRGEAAKQEAEEQFKRIATAYEILRDDEARTDYDYMLDNPSHYYAHYYRYYRRRVAPKVDIRLVLGVTISVISAIQYFSMKSNYDTAIKYFMTVQKYRNRAMDMATDEEKAFQRNKRLSKAQQKEETEKLIRRIIEQKMDIKGAYAKPDLKSILWVQLLISPYTLSRYVAWSLRWLWLFTVLGREYGDAEKLYLIRRQLKMGQHQFDAIEEDEKEEYLELELWRKENFREWKQQQEEEKKKELAESARYKQYRRYMKNHGPGRMTFED